MFREVRAHGERCLYDGDNLIEPLACAAPIDWDLPRIDPKVVLFRV